MKLEIKHLAPYLPYRLNWTLQKSNEFIMSGITNETLYTESGAILTWPRRQVCEKAINEAVLSSI